MTTIGIELDGTAKATTARELQATLAELVDLSLQGKQAHWHVTGGRFLPLHEQLDTLVDDARGWSDDVAERLVTLGSPADGRAATVAATTPLDEFPQGFVDQDKVVALVVDRLGLVASDVRRRAELLGGPDLASQDLLIEILRGVEKHLWMFQAQR